MIFLNTSSLLIMMYVLKVKPLTSVYLNSLEIFNELMFFVCSCAIIAFTDYGPPPVEVMGEEVDTTVDENEMRTYVGWSYIGVSCLIILISMGGLIIISLHAIYSKIKEKCEERRRIA